MKMNRSGKLLTAAGLICFALAFVLLSSFRGEFGKDTAGKSSLEQSMMPEMEDTIDVAPSKNGGEEPKKLASVAGGGDDGDGKIVVYVTGAVKKPGVYELPSGARAVDAMKAAGGFTEKADQEAVNLAAKLTDGEQLKFMRRGEASSSAPAARTGTGASSAATSSAAVRQSASININRATQAELESLRGVGPKTAQAIIEYRTKNGSFTRIEDIMNVKGIGPKKFEAMKDSISVGN